MPEYRVTFEYEFRAHGFRTVDAETYEDAIDTVVAMLEEQPPVEDIDDEELVDVYAVEVDV